VYGRKRNGVEEGQCQRFEKVITKLDVFQGRLFTDAQPSEPAACSEPSAVILVRNVRRHTALHEELRTYRGRASADPHPQSEWLNVE